MVDFGNTCALICRFILLILLLYSIILSCMVMSSCHFISAVTRNEEIHGVGLQSFENENGDCEGHNSFVKNNYNGMEMAAKVGGYVAPTCGCIVFVWLLAECCLKGGCWGGKCIPFVLILGAVACQGITFLLFQSDLFCSNKDIARCAMGDAGYRSLQACLVYAFCAILFYCGPTPIAPFSAQKMARTQSSTSASGKKKKKEQEKKVEPGKDEEWTKELYEQRRKEKKVKGRGVSGRSKKDIFDDLNNGKDRSSKDRSRDRDRDDNYHENSLAIYDHDKKRSSSRDRRKNEPKFDEYVDTEPDGMDWSAYTPDKREAHYERERSKKKERKERKRRKERDNDSYHNGSPRSPTRDEEYSVIEYDDSYRRDGDKGRGGDGGGYEDSYRDGSHRDSYYSDRDHGNSYEMSQQYGRSADDRGRGGGDYGSPGSGRGGSDHRSSQNNNNNDDYSYAQDSYVQDYHTNDNDPPDDYHDSYNTRSTSRRSGGGGGRPSVRSNSRDRGSSPRNNDSHYDDSYAESYDSRRGGYRDDPSFV